ncbi:MAG: hypothetical protein QG657_1165 [Acidobacteriota bacterium]|nr:hypothetical protein [Acidobacteriota bacterium]
MTENIINDESSIQVYQDVIERFTTNPDFPYLISFPRTGSHWLRMIMELYFEKPSLVRIFYFKEMRDFTCCHRHDESLEIERKNVLYLYRCPVDTVYSQLNYYKEDPFDTGRIAHWTGLYARHLSKWLLEETFTTQKTILAYERLKTDPAREFAKVCAHFAAPFNRDRLETALKMVTKEEVKKRTVHDPQVINLARQYTMDREIFTRRFSSTIMASVYAVNPLLKSFFKEEII